VCVWAPSIPGSFSRDSQCESSKETDTSPYTRTQHASISLSLPSLFSFFFLYIYIYILSRQIHFTLPPVVHCKRQNRNKLKKTGNLLPSPQSSVLGPQSSLLLINNKSLPSFLLFSGVKLRTSQSMYIHTLDHSFS
jgi:hypothetical protein